jgi:hypothetical protein
MSSIALLQPRYDACADYSPSCFGRSGRHPAHEPKFVPSRSFGSPAGEPMYALLDRRPRLKAAIPAAIFGAARN